MSKVTVAFVLWTMLTYTACLDYFWDPDDPLFDCTVAVYYKNNQHLLGTGTFYKKNRVIGSRHPLMMTNANYYNTLLYVVNGTYYNSTPLNPLNGFTEHGCGRARVYLSYVSYPSYTCITDDIHIFFLDTEVPSALQLFDIVNYKPIAKGYRQPFYFPLADKYTPEETSNWMTAGFGMIDRKDIKASNRIIPIYYTEPVLVDCDEYIPHSWGEFICILNVDHYPGIALGAPLIQNGHIFGIGCFCFKRGKESIFVFTDVRKYLDIISDL